MKNEAQENREQVEKLFKFSKKILVPVVLRYAGCLQVNFCLNVRTEKDKIIIILDISKYGHHFY